MHGLFPGVENARKSIQFRIPRARSASELPAHQFPNFPRAPGTLRPAEVRPQLGDSAGGSVRTNKTGEAVHAPPALRSVSLSPVPQLLPLRCRRPPLPQPAAPRTPPPRLFLSGRAELSGGQAARPGLLPCAGGRASPAGQEGRHAAAGGQASGSPAPRQARTSPDAQLQLGAVQVHHVVAKETVQDVHDKVLKHHPAAGPPPPPGSSSGAPTAAAAAPRRSGPSRPAPRLEGAAQRCPRPALTAPPGCGCGAQGARLLGGYGSRWGLRGSAGLGSCPGRSVRRLPARSCKGTSCHRTGQVRRDHRGRLV